MHRSVPGELVDVDVDDELVVEVVVEVVRVDVVEVVVASKTRQSFQPEREEEPSELQLTVLLSKSIV